MSSPPTAHAWFIDIQFQYHDPGTGRDKEGFLRISVAGIDDAVYQAGQAAHEFLVELGQGYGWRAIPTPQAVTITAAVLM